MKYSNNMTPKMTPKIEDVQRRTLKRIISLPPYHYIVGFLDKLKQQQYDKERYSEQDIHLIKTLYDTFSKDLDRDINEKLRLIEIEKDLIKLIENTDNKIFYRRLFFPSIFINNEFKFENWIIKGILVEEVFSKFDSGVCLSAKNTDNFNDYIIFISAIDQNKTDYWNISFSLIDKNTVPILDVYKYGEKDKKDKDQKKRIEHYIRNIICNMVDMVEGNDEDLNVVIIETTKEQNEKRIKKGKVQFPTKVYIRAKGEFKKYVQKFNTAYEDDEKRKLGHKFLVRGHWMNFRAPRYVRKQGERTWVKPFWKGEGIAISKDYKLIQIKEQN